ncbi:MurR/RpiR family transcriptional regulator [Alkalibacillus aidingensis]|uniref:MurR/RpiR family transcriptional regulator n=1 Tax=Alkalibacillus aidingensis TaxID=2747607 RepID=UPI0016602548|nr:MurR/RpiR family transcriptional regulator [Alkalibacillus aidingensis]
MAELKGGLIILKEMVDHLPPSEQKIANYVIQNPQQSIQMTALSLGNASQTSSAAVIRMCKSLGFKSFQEFKLRVAGDLRVDSSTEYRDIEPNESYEAIIEKVTSNTVQTIKESADILDSKRLTNAVEALINAKSILFVGFGASYITAKDAEQKFIRINKPVQAFSDLHMAATTVANKGEGDVVVGISFSGNTREVEKILSLANRNGAKTISITKYGKSRVAELADIQLFTSAAREPAFRSGATSSRIAQLHLIDILFMCLASDHFDQTVHHIDQTREAISFIKDES